MTSSDGLDWMTRPSPLGTTDEFYGLAIGSGGRVVPVGYRAVYSTTDLVTWTDHTTGSYPDLRKIAYNGTQYVAGRNAGRVLTSEDDGATWTDRTSGVSGRITGIAYGMDRWVISSDSISAFTHFPLGTSTNGIDWVRPDTSEDFTDCRGVAYGNGVFVAIPKTGTSTLAYSTDGLNWTETTHPWFTALQDRNFIAFGGDHFVAWGDSNSTVSVAISSNGTDWQTYSTGLATPVPEAGAYGNGRWVLVGDDGRVLTSTDLVNWSAQTILFEGDLVDLNDVAYGNGHWVIVGNDQTVWSSADGVNWDAAFRTQLGWNFYGVTFDGDSFWCVGERGAIYESQLISSQLLPPVLRIQSSSIPSAVELHIEGVSGEMWNVDYKPVLTNASWIYETTVTLTNESHVHVQSLPESGQGFFRLSQP